VTEYPGARSGAPIESPIPVGAVPLKSILYTEELHRRPSRPANYEEENRALVKLASALADSPSTIFQTLAETILRITRCDSAGLSLLTTDGRTPDVGGNRFYWPAIAGMWNPHVGGGTPRNFGPCGDVLDQNSTLLFKHFERRYPYLLPVFPAADECLLVPFYVADKAVGTIWAIMHSDRRKFDAEDDRVMDSLGKFASSAYQTLASIDELRFQIGEREKAEAALHKLTEGLETEVRVRTRDLERTRSELIASRARIVAAGDEARRRIERNLHDGTQQRLVAIGLNVATVRDKIPADQQDARSGLERIRHELEAVLEDVRELSHGLHPALLSHAGLGPSLRALARRSPIPVKLDVRVSERPSESIETAVYYVISEALANAAKHARASEISVVLTTSRSEIRAIVEDDGGGGAEASAGSGLVGLIDRIEALGGKVALHSPPGHGTRISIEMPLAAEPISDVARVPGGSRATPSDGPPPLPELPQAVDAAILHTAVAACADALYMVDPRGRIRFLNAAALQILGYEDERQLLGRPSHDTIHNLRRDGTPFPAAECPLLRPRLNGETVRVEEDWFVRQDGSLVKVSYSSAPVALPNGRGAVVSFREGHPV
jgi:PAS domain S-box-containing protein